MHPGPSEAQGVEWLIEATGCSPASLRDASALHRLFRSIVSDLDLHPIGEPTWHIFPGERGVTGFWLLRESHLAVHTFPEFTSLCLNLFCCKERRDADWQKILQAILGANEIRVRRLRRDYTPRASAETR